ncbi:hypothetical protein GCM10010321_04170 [Streptomyces chartreusis]|nr:hypothetical protein GCM10010321_04170 [Streptomyces chartreusis]
MGDTGAQTPRERYRAQVQAEIKERAWEQIAAAGVTALSQRGRQTDGCERAHAPPLLRRPRRVDHRTRSTYGGMLEGYPCKPVNDMKVRSLQRQAERAFPSTPVHAAPPPASARTRLPAPSAPVEVLPSVKRMPSINCRRDQTGGRPALIPFGSNGSNTAHCSSVRSPRPMNCDHSQPKIHFRYTA